MIPADMIAVVCGSTTPVGAALVARMLASGLLVVTIDPPEVPAHPSALLALVGDLTDEQGWAAFVSELTRRDLHPAMVVYALSEAEPSAALGDLAQAAWDRALARHVRGPYLACRALFPLMRQPGAVVLLASVLAAWDARADQAALSASGGGVLALSQSLALSGAQYQVRVNTVCFDMALEAWFAKPEDQQRLLDRTPLGRATSPEDIVDAIMFLLSEDASYLTGSSLVVDGGQTLQSWSNAPDDSYHTLSS